MKRKLLHIVLLAILICGIICSCNKEETKVIPRGKLAKIYAEMLMTDQWIVMTPGVRMVADTSLIYEPILDKYGYDSDDYRKSVETYMDDPERFARILRTTGELLQDRITELEKQQKIMELKAKLPKLRYNIDWNEYFPYLFEEPYVHYYDSVAFEPDSAMCIYRLKSIERADTIYDRIRMIIRDSLSIKDSLAFKDSLAVADSLAAADSIALIDSVVLKRVNFPDHKSKLTADGVKKLSKALDRGLDAKNKKEIE